jgi:cell filamentation protein
LPANEFAEKAAHFLGELNAIHAFREGNGRTQLTFFALLAHRAGQPLDLEKLDPELMLNL